MKLYDMEDRKRGMCVYTNFRILLGFENCMKCMGLDGTWIKIDTGFMLHYSDI